MTRRPAALFVLLVIAVSWVAAVSAAPLLARRASLPATSLAAVTYVCGSVICHQQAERSFHVAGHQLPVCARCAGLYAGGALGVLGWIVVAGVRRTPSRRSQALLARPSRVRIALISLAIPTGLTVATGMAGLWDPGNVTRALLAVPLGAAVGVVVSAAAAGDLR